MLYGAHFKVTMITLDFYLIYLIKVKKFQFESNNNKIFKLEEFISIFLQKFVIEGLVLINIYKRITGINESLYH